MNHKDFKKWRKEVLNEVDNYPSLKAVKVFISNTFLKSCYYKGYTAIDTCNAMTEVT